MSKVIHVYGHSYTIEEAEALWEEGTHMEGQMQYWPNEEAQALKDAIDAYRAKHGLDNILGQSPNGVQGDPETDLCV